MKALIFRPARSNSKEYGDLSLRWGKELTVELAAYHIYFLIGVSCRLQCLTGRLLSGNDIMLTLTLYYS